MSERVRNQKLNRKMETPWRDDKKRRAPLCIGPHFSLVCLLANFRDCFWITDAELKWRRSSGGNHRLMDGGRCWRASPLRHLSTSTFSHLMWLLLCLWGGEDRPCSPCAVCLCRRARRRTSSRQMRQGRGLMNLMPRSQWGSLGDSPLASLTIQPHHLCLW